MRCRIARVRRSRLRAPARASCRRSGSPASRARGPRPRGGRAERNQHARRHVEDHEAHRIALAQAARGLQHGTLGQPEAVDTAAALAHAARLVDGKHDRRRLVEGRRLRRSRAAPTRASIRGSRRAQTNVRRPAPAGRGRAASRPPPARSRIADRHRQWPRRRAPPPDSRRVRRPGRRVAPPGPRSASSRRAAGCAPENPDEPCAYRMAARGETSITAASGQASRDCPDAASCSATSTSAAPARSASNSIVARPAPSGSLLATWSAPLVERVATVTRSGLSNWPASCTRDLDALAGQCPLRSQYLGDARRRRRPGPRRSIAAAIEPRARRAMRVPRRRRSRGRPRSRPCWRTRRLGVQRQGGLQRRLDVRGRWHPEGHGRCSARAARTGLSANSIKLRLACAGRACGASTTSRHGLVGVGPRHALRAVDQQQYPRLAAWVEPDVAEQRQTQIATSAPTAAPAPPSFWEPPALMDRASAYSAQSARLPDERDDFPQQHQQGSHEQRPCPIAEDRATRSSAARSRRCSMPAVGATMTATGPRSSIAISSSRRPPNSCSNIRFTSSGISGPAWIAIEPKSNEVSISFDAPARAMITGSSPAASSTVSAGRACKLRRHLQSSGIEPDAARLGHGGRPLHRSRRSRRRAVCQHSDRRHARGRRARVPQSSTASTSVASSGARARAGCAPTAATSAAGQFGSMATRRLRSGARSRAISSSSASASPGCSVARTPADAGIAALDECRCSRLESMRRSAHFARVGGDDQLARFRWRCRRSSASAAGRSFPGRQGFDAPTGAPARRCA